MRTVLLPLYVQSVRCADADEAENRRKRRAVYEPDATVKVSRQTETGADADVKGDVSNAAIDVRSSPLPNNSNGDGAADRKQSPLTCPQCDFSADERAVLWRHVRAAHSRHQSSTSSPDVNNDDDDVDVETEDAGSAMTPDDDVRDLFCVDCSIQFTSPGTYRAHRSFYCKRRGKRSANDVSGGSEEDAGARRRRRASGSGANVAEQVHTRCDNLRPPTDLRPALFPSSLAALSSPAGLMEMLSAGVAPPPPHPGAFFLAPFLAAAAAAAAAGVQANGLATGSAVVQQSSPNLSTASRPLQPSSAERRSSTSVSDDEPLDLSTCRTVANDVRLGKRDSVSPAAAAVSPASAVGFSRQFAAPGIDSLDTSTLFLPPTARLPLNANLPLPAVRPPLSSPPSISHCAECNIVFYKHANYLAHKAHYCAGRHAAPSSGAQDQPGGISGPAGKSATMLKSDDVARGSTLLDDGRRRSPEPHELVATLDDTGTTIQFYCIPCKIKFSSLDTLRAHKQFYCPARFEAPPTSTSGELATSTRHRHTSRVYSGAEDGERQAGDLASAGGSCTACGTRVTSPRSGHRCAAAAAVAPSLYQCPHCDYTAQSDSRLVEHVRAHAPSRAFRCALCGYRGNTVRGMRMHGKMHNDEAAAAAGRGADAVQLPTFTDDCVIEYEEPPAIPARRHSSTAAGGCVAARPGVDTELLRQKNEPYKRRRSRKAYEKAEYAPAAATTPVICAECSAPLLDTTHAQAHASAHAAERLLAWEALYSAGTITKTPAVAPAPACKADVDVDQQQTASPVTDEATVKSALLPAVKVEQSDSVEHETTTDNVDDDDGTKCNGTDATPVDEHKSSDVRHDRTASTSPAHDVDVTACVSSRRSSSLDVASRYCEQCDITFMYASTFIAHKKYYCSSHAAERADAPARPSAATGVAV